MLLSVEYPALMPGRDPPNPYSLPEIAKRLKLLRDAMGKTQVAMGDLAGVTDKAWQNYEAGIRRIEIDAVTRLRAALGVTSEWVYYGNVYQMPDELLDAMRLAAKKRVKP